MRKSTILIVAVVYCASVLFIIFFGTQLGVFNQNIQIDRIEFVDERIRTVGEGADQRRVLEIFENDILWEDGDFVVSLAWVIHPYNATRANLIFELSVQTDIVEIVDRGNPVRIVFRGYQVYPITIIARADDGGGARDEVMILFPRG